VAKHRKKLKLQENNKIMKALKIICLVLGLIIVTSCITSSTSSSIPYGNWMMMSCQRNGQKQLVKNIYITFHGNQFEVSSDGVIVESGATTFNTSASPMQYDAIIAGKSQEKNKVYQAIYKIEGDIMVACINLQTAGRRPEDFSTSTGTTYQLVKWKRMDNKFKCKKKK
jgi:uncharacterized protein (TIGR03067 family)